MENKEQDTYSYKGWLNSDSFLKRALAVWGYYFVANLIIGVVVSIAMLGVFTLAGTAFFSVLNFSGFN